MGLFFGHLTDFSYVKANVFLNQGPLEFAIAILAILFMEFVQLQNRDEEVRSLCSRSAPWLRWTVYYAVCFGILF